MKARFLWRWLRDGRWCTRLRSDSRVVMNGSRCRLSCSLRRRSSTRELVSRHHGHGMSLCIAFPGRRRSLRSLRLGQQSHNRSAHPRSHCHACRDRSRDHQAVERHGRSCTRSAPRALARARHVPRGCVNQRSPLVKPDRSIDRVVESCVLPSLHDTSYKRTDHLVLRDMSCMPVRCLRRG